MNNCQADEALRRAVSEAVWATIRLVNELGGTSAERYERLLEYGELVDLGLRLPSAVDWILTLIEPWRASGILATDGSDSAT